MGTGKKALSLCEIIPFQWRSNRKSKGMLSMSQQLQMSGYAREILVLVPEGRQKVAGGGACGTTGIL